MRVLECRIDYDQVIERCGTLSIYEGRDAVDANGESIFLKLKITAQDEPLIKVYAKEAAHIIEPRFGDIVTGTTINDTGIVFMMEYDDTRWSKDLAFKDAVFESIVLYCMGQWFAYNGDADKAARFNTMCSEVTAASVEVLFSKKKPRLSRNS